MTFHSIHGRSQANDPVEEEHVVGSRSKIELCGEKRGAVLATVHRVSASSHLHLDDAARFHPTSPGIANAERFIGGQTVETSAVYFHLCW
jgi:hypothetical protein